MVAHQPVKAHDDNGAGESGVDDPVPCFQSQYGWLARKALRPQVGGVLLDVWLDDAGRLARMRHELVSFEPIEDDWDREASAAVARGWSPQETTA